MSMTGSTSRLRFNNRVYLEHYRNGVITLKANFFNMITNIGKNTILDTCFNGITPISNASWSIGIIDNASYTAVSATDTAASHAGWIENIGYSGGVRPAWGSTFASAQQITNPTAVTFNITVSSATYQGIFIISNNTLNGTTGVLWSTALFPSTVPVANGDQIKISYNIAC